MREDLEVLAADIADPRSGSAGFKADNPATTVAYDDSALTSTIVGNRG
jgi:hypothetical protein